MIKAYLLIGLFLVSILIIGCAPVEEPGPLCKPPYYEYMVGECCLDQNNNSICDRDEAQKEVEIEELKEEKPLNYTLKEITKKINQISGRNYDFQVNLDDDRYSLFNYSSLEDKYIFYRSNFMEDFIIIDMIDPQISINSFKDLEKFKDDLINGFINHYDELISQWSGIDYQDNIDIFIDEREIENSKIIFMSFMNRAFYKNTLDYLLLQNRALIPCGNYSIILIGVQDPSKGQLYAGPDRRGYLDLMKLESEYRFQENLATIKQIVNFCSKSVGDDFYSTSINAEHIEKIMNGQDYNINMEFEVAIGVPKDVYNPALRLHWGKDNIVYFKVKNKAFDLTDPYLEVEVTYDGDTKKYSTPLGKFNTEDYYEYYLKLPEDVVISKVDIKLYKSWAKEIIYDEQIFNFE